MFFKIPYSKKKKLRNWEDRKCVIIILHELRLHDQHRHPTDLKGYTDKKSKARAGSTACLNNSLPILKLESLTSSPISKPKRKVVEMYIIIPRQ